jgi:hypothetical protein
MWRAFGSVAAASAAVAYVTRPTAAPPATAAAPGDTGGGEHHDLSDRASLPPTLQAQVMDRVPFPQLLYHVGQHLVVFSCTTVSRVFMYLGGRFRVKEDDHYGTFVARGRYRGMIAGGEHLYDAAAAICINHELGADIRYADGQPMRYDQLTQGQTISRTWFIFPPETGFFLKDVQA